MFERRNHRYVFFNSENIYEKTAVEFHHDIFRRARFAAECDDFFINLPVFPKRNCKLREEKNQPRRKAAVTVKNQQNVWCDSAEKQHQHQRQKEDKPVDTKLFAPDEKCAGKRADEKRIDFDSRAFGKEKPDASAAKQKNA